MFTLPPNLNVYITAALFVLGAYLFALYLGMVVWTFRDIRSRSRDALAVILATLLVALFTLPGLLVYMLLRPHTTLEEQHERHLAEEAILQDLEERRICPGCQRRIEADYLLCPDCHYQLRLRCPSCDRLLNPSWDICPYCGVYRDTGAYAAPEQAEPEMAPEPAAPAVEAIELAPLETELAAGEPPASQEGAVSEESTFSQEETSSLSENAR
jgi:RNA polymerase subunit RPABC4/transcription elongation factor Spt4